MKIAVHSSKAVKPDYESCGVAPGSTTDVAPLTVLDKANFDTYVSLIYGFRPPAPPNAVLEAGLARALVDYREWAGRLGVNAKDNRAILLNDAGARFVEATADVALDSVMPLKPTPEVQCLHPSGDDGPEELMLIQITRFACGSLVVGLSHQHIVSDGRATCNFLAAWSQATRGALIDPVPVHDRASFFQARDPLLVEHEHRGVEFKPYDKAHDHAGGGSDDEVVVNKVHFSREFISKLKAQASAGAGRPYRYSTLNCVVAHLWRSMTKARGLDGGESTSVAIAMDGRRRMSPQVPDGYTGNVVLWARPTATAGELLARPVKHAVELIGREVARIDDGYFKSFIDFACSGAVEKERLVATADAAEMVLSPNIEVDSLLRMPFNDMDFGGGGPIFFMPSYLPVEGVIFLLPSFLGDGSVDAYVSLFRREMHTFNNCCWTPEKFFVGGESLSGGSCILSSKLKSFFFEIQRICEV